MSCVLGEEMVVLSPLLHPHLRDGGHWGSRPPVSINQELFIPSLTGGDQLTGCQGGQLTDGETSWLNSQLISPLLFRLLKFIFCREVSWAVLAWCVCKKFSIWIIRKSVFLLFVLKSILHPWNLLFFSRRKNTGREDPRWISQMWVILQETWIWNQGFLLLNFYKERRVLPKQANFSIIV